MIQKSIDECNAAHTNATRKLTEVLAAYGYNMDFVKVTGWAESTHPRTPFLEVSVETTAPSGSIERRLLIPNFVITAEDHVAAAQRWAVGAVA